MKLTSSLKSNQAETKWKIQHSLVHSCDTWCPPKIAQDFKNLWSWNGKDFSTGDEIEKEPTTWSPSWNTTEMLYITICAEGEGCRLPPRSCQTPIRYISIPTRYRKSPETFIGRSRAGGGGQQEKSSFDHVQALLVWGRWNLGLMGKVQLRHSPLQKTLYFLVCWCSWDHKLFPARWSMMPYNTGAPWSAWLIPSPSLSLSASEEQSCKRKQLQKLFGFLSQWAAAWQ